MLLSEQQQLKSPEDGLSSSRLWRLGCPISVTDCCGGSSLPGQRCCARLFPVSRVRLCSLLAVPRQQVFNAGKPIPRVLQGSPMSSLQRERPAALPALRRLSRPPSPAAGDQHRGDAPLNLLRYLPVEQPRYPVQLSEDGEGTLHTSRCNCERRTSATGCPSVRHIARSNPARAQTPLSAGWTQPLTQRRAPAFGS